jgi:hypothetical protein
MSKFKPKARVIFKIGSEVEAQGRVVSGPHPLTEEQRAEYREMFARSRAPKEFYIVKSRDGQHECYPSAMRLV